MVQVVLNLSEEVLSSQRKSVQEFGEDLRLAAAIFWYQRGEISQEKASQIAGLNRRDFLQVLANYNIDVFQVDFDDLDRELVLAK
jgi:predicted HTH domain antitoxin